MKRLFVNADDFGLSPGVCRGIAHAMSNGIVTGTTVMPCVPGVASLLDQYGPELSGRLGVHLQLTKGKPCLPKELVPSLVAPNGDFPLHETEVSAPDTEEVIAEFRAQVQKLRDHGIEPSHIDAHHHIHKLPQVFPAYCRLALELEVPARGLGTALSMALRQQNIPTADGFIREWFKNDLTAERLLLLVQQTFAHLKENTGGDDLFVELMTHPGFNDSLLSSRSSYTAWREQELEILCSPQVLEGLNDMDIELAPASMLACKIRNESHA